MGSQRVGHSWVTNTLQTSGYLANCLNQNSHYVPTADMCPQVWLCLCLCGPREHTLPYNMWMLDFSNSPSASPVSLIPHSCRSEDKGSLTVLKVAVTSCQGRVKSWVFNLLCKHLVLTSKCAPSRAHGENWERRNPPETTPQGPLPSLSFLINAFSFSLIPSRNQFINRRLNFSYQSSLLNKLRRIHFLEQNLISTLRLTHR